MQGRWKEWEIERNAYRDIIASNRREIKKWSASPEKWKKYHPDEDTPTLLTDSLLEKMVGLVNVIMFTEKRVEEGLAWSKFVKDCIEEHITFLNKKSFHDFWSLEKFMQEHGVTNMALVDRMYELWLMESLYNFESYIFYLERYREQNKRFYLKRMTPLSTVLHDLEDLANRKIKFLGISLPSRTGKSTLCIFFLTWIGLKRPDSHSAMCGHSGVLADGFYDELLNIITSSEYTFGEMYKFWHNTTEMLEDKSAEYKKINLGRPDRFSTFTCRGIDGTWTGDIDISLDGILYVDDLVRDRVHALSPTRMEGTWNDYLNKVVDRKSGEADENFDGSCELMVGTLWNVFDPLYRMETLHKDDPLYVFRKIPALNEDDETNFLYQYTTDYLHDMRETLGAADWSAKWMQAPYIREGLLYQPNEMMYFNGEVPDCDKTIVLLDPAVGGGDYLSMVVLKVVGKFYYVIDWLYSKETKGKTIPRIAEKIIFHKASEFNFEKNGIGRAFDGEVTEELHKRGYFMCKSTPFNAPEGMKKEEKIIGASDWVKMYVYFIADDVKNATYTRSQDYTKAMGDVFMHSTEGKNKTDDAVDTLAQINEMHQARSNGTIDIILNPFR